MSFQRLLVAVDDEDPAPWATDAAIRLARQVGATLAFVNVIPSSLAPPSEMGFIEPDTPSDEILRNGVVSDEIVDAAREWNADLIVIGNHPRPLLERLLLGNTTKGVLQQAPRPVLVVNKPTATSTRPLPAPACALSQH